MNQFKNTHLKHRVSNFKAPVICQWRNVNNKNCYLLQFYHKFRIYILGSFLSQIWNCVRVIIKELPNNCLFPLACDQSILCPSVSNDILQTFINKVQGRCHLRNVIIIIIIIIIDELADHQWVCDHHWYRVSEQAVGTLLCVITRNYSCLIRL